MSGRVRRAWAPEDRVAVLELPATAATAGMEGVVIEDAGPSVAGCRLVRVRLDNPPDPGHPVRVYRETEIRRVLPPGRR